jgi:hypothetical protein
MTLPRRMSFALPSSFGIASIAASADDLLSSTTA